MAMATCKLILVVCVQSPSISYVKRTLRNKRNLKVMNIVVFIK